LNVKGAWPLLTFESMELLSQVSQTLLKYKMLISNERVLIACSGGADSVALLHVLKELAPRLKIRLHLLHFDHALRRTSARDLEFVKKMACRYRIPFHGGRRKVLRGAAAKNQSPEERAREIRYEFFEKVAQKTGIRKIALAHHRDDQAETVLMRVIQGTGLRGLQGIRPVVRKKKITYIRPFIETGRTEIRAYLKKNKIAFREDPTNQSFQFLRNRIRGLLLPLIEKKFNPRIREALAHLAETATAESSGFDEWVEENWKTYLKSRAHGTLWLERERFLALPPPLQFRLLNRIVGVLDPQSGIDFRSWKRIENRLADGKLRMSLPRNLDFKLTPKKLFVRKSVTMKTVSGQV